MRRIVASLAAVLLALSAAGCGGGGAEPDAPDDGAHATRALELILDFQPNAVHTGLYVADLRGYFADRGLEVTLRPPGASTDAPKLLRTGRADLAILDIHDLAIAREAGIDLVGVAAIVQSPLAAVIAGDREQVDRPADLAGRTVGVTGLPSDDAVLETVLASGGLGLGDVDTVTIGFNAVPQLLAGRIDAATAFWNAEGVALSDRLPTREFRLADFSSVPAYPELVLTTTPDTLAAKGDAIGSAVEAIEEGYDETTADPDAALADLLAAVPELVPQQARAELDAVLPALGRSRELDREVLDAWSSWEAQNGIVEAPPDVVSAFDFDVASAGK
jgi:putative hydroxymethylpyrimidine transport system substrate-binding protein